MVLQEPDLTMEQVAIMRYKEQCWSSSTNSMVSTHVAMSRFLWQPTGTFHSNHIIMKGTDSFYSNYIMAMGTGSFYARHFTTLASSVDRDVNGGPVGRN